MKILIYPRAFDNPYHELLYGVLRNKYPMDSFRYVESSPVTVIFFPLVMAIRRTQGYRIFHIHWLAFYLDPKYHIPFAKQISFINTLWSIYVLKILRYKLIWTVHDLLPHDSQTVNDRYIARTLAKKANAKIMLSSYIAHEMKRLKINTNNIYNIPLGNYKSIYNVSISRSKVLSRKKLHIPSNSFVFLSFGRVEPYKGLDSLIKAFTQLVTLYPNKKMTLVIAGMCNKSELKEELNLLVKNFSKNKFPNGKLILHAKYIKDIDVRIYHQSADIEIYPFKEITNSSSVLLSLAFGKAVIAPKIGAIQDLPKEIGFFYKANSLNALVNSMEMAVNSNHAERIEMLREIVKYSSSFSWDKIADQTYRVYQELSITNQNSSNDFLAKKL